MTRVYPSDTNVRSCHDAAEQARLLDELPVAATAGLAQLDLMAISELGGQIHLLALVKGGNA
jgi:hypothetical protein